MEGRGLAGRLRVTRLFDAYGRLLTARQQRMVRLYYLDDFSLGEIAEQFAITRQAVYDSLKRSVSELQRLEEILQVLEDRHQVARRQQQVTKRVDALEKLMGELDGRVASKALEPLREALTHLRRAIS